MKKLIGHSCIIILLVLKSILLVSAHNGFDKEYNFIKSHSNGSKEVDIDRDKYSISSYADFSQHKQSSAFKTDPTISCPPSRALELTDNCDRRVVWNEPIAPDGYFLGKTAAPGDTFDIGVTTVEYLLIDETDFRIVDQCSFTVTLIDQLAPEVSECPTDITIPANGNCEAIVNWTEPIFTDNCEGLMTPSVNFAPGSVFPLGSTEVVYSVTDEGGNITECKFVVTVEDQTAPNFTVFPSDIVVSAKESSCDQNVTWNEVQATDNCSATITMSSNFKSGDLFPVGQSLVEYSVSDENGNTQTQSFTVNVVDDAPPTVQSCPENVEVFLSSNCTAEASWTMPVFTDNCDNNLQIQSSHSSGDLFSLGTTEVSITAEDDAGNITSCEFSVIVKDTIAPEITNCPQTIIVGSSANCGAQVSWEPPNAIDNCNGEIQGQSAIAPGSFFEIGDTEVSYIFTDNSGVSAECTFIIRVEDEVGPTFVNMPNDIEVSADENCSAVVSWEIPEVDDCSATTVVSDANSGDLFPVGTSIVTYIATDEAGNSSMDSFAISVVDRLPPSVESFPSDTTIQIFNECSLSYKWKEPIVRDNCSEVSVSSNLPNESLLEIGENVITYSFEDEAGNSTDSSFTISLVDGRPIEILNCPTDIEIISDDTGVAEVSWDPPSVNSNSCGSIEISSTHEPGDFFEEGVTEIIYSFTREDGVVAECSFLIQISLPELLIDPSEIVTPNGDGKNDFWQINNIEKFENNEVLIVDRWGNVVYEITSYNNDDRSWKGDNAQGEPLQRGTYYYFVSIMSNGNRIESKGFIELLR